MEKTRVVGHMRKLFRAPAAPPLPFTHILIVPIAYRTFVDHFSPSFKNRIVETEREINSKETLRKKLAITTDRHEHGTHRIRY